MNELNKIDDDAKSDPDEFSIEISDTRMRGPLIYIVAPLGSITLFCERHELESLRNAIDEVLEGNSPRKIVFAE